jgi:hypothetical protein
MASIARRRRGDLPAARDPRHRGFRQSSIGLTALLLWGCFLAAGTARAQGTPALLVSTSSRASRQDAVRSLPLDQLDDDTKAKVAYVVNQAGIFRRLPVQVIDCDPDMYLFLIRHPEVIVNIWELMGISKVTMERTGPNSFEASDHAGSRGSVFACYSNQDTHLIYAEGSYDGPLFTRPIKARCVLLLKSAYSREANNRDYVTCRMDAFIHIENVGVDLLAKTFQPLITKSADTNFSETAAFLSMVSKTAARNSRGMVRLAAKLALTQPDVRQQFAVVSNQVGTRAAARQTDAANPDQAAYRQGQPAAAQQRR